MKAGVNAFGFFTIFEKKERDRLCRLNMEKHAGGWGLKNRIYAIFFQMRLFESEERFTLICICGLCYQPMGRLTGE
jgi:hypothetical protein